MGEGAVGLRHAFNVIFLFDCGAHSVGSFKNFRREAARHWHSFAVTSGTDDPAERKHALALWNHFKRNLIHGSSNAFWTHFHGRFCVFNGTEKYFFGILVAALLKFGKHLVENSSSGRLFALRHNRIDELFTEFIGIRGNVGGDASFHSLFLGFLSAITTAALFAVLYALAIEHTSNNVVTYSWQIFHTASANHHNGVFLQVVTFTADVSVYFHSVSEANTRNLSESRVRLFGRHGCYLGAHSSFERAGQGSILRLQGIENGLKCGRFAFYNALYTRFAYELVDGWHKI